MGRYQGHKVLVTGASSGIGRCLAIELSKQGNKVVLCGRDEARLKETLAQMDSGKDHICVPFDLNSFDAYNELFDAAISDGQKLDGMVHCAGIATPTPVRMLSAARVLDIINTNYVAFMCMVSMYAKKKYGLPGSIVAVSSINTHYMQQYMSVYSGSKAALEASVRALALELSEKNIRINTIVPGAVNTPMAKEMDKDNLEEIVSKQLLGLIEPEQIAEAIIYLLSDESRYMTGRELYMDGGRLGQ